MEQDTACTHRNFNATVNVIRLDDIGRFVAEVAITCVDCGIPMQFAGVSPGFNFDLPTVTLDGLQVSLPIYPQGTHPTPLQGLAGYTISEHN